MRKTYSVTKSSYPYIEPICKRDGIEYEIKPSPKGNGYVFSADISRSRFKELIEDIACEKQRGNSKIPVYSYRTLQNNAKRERLSALNGTSAFHVLKSDQKKMKREVWM